MTLLKVLPIKLQSVKVKVLINVGGMQTKGHPVLFLPALLGDVLTCSFEMHASMEG